MRDPRRKPKPPKRPAAPAPESLRSEFGDKLDAEPAYGEARVWAVARDPRCLFAYWKFRPSEHPAAAGPDGVPRFHLRILREDSTEETTVGIEPAAGNWFVPVSKPDTSYFAELGFFSNGVWCFIARSGNTRTPPEVAADETLEFFATIPARLSLRKLRDMLASSAIPGEEVAQTASRIQAAAQKQGEWTGEQERMLAHILAEEMEKQPAAAASSVTLAERIRRRLAAAAEASVPAGPLPSQSEGEAPASPGSNWPASPGASWGNAPVK